MPHSSTSRLEALQARHDAISHKIMAESSRPGPNDMLIGMLKRQKLHLKDEIEEISG